MIESSVGVTDGGPAGPAAVDVRGLWKVFRGPPGSPGTLRRRIAHPLSSQRQESIEALRDVTLAVGPGEFVGVVGRNGSGKSTLLRCIAGIYRPDRGEVEVAGSIATVIELGVGFNPELSGRENAVTNAVLLGLSRREAREQLPGILDFAGVGSLADLELKHYSSGMRARLAFGVVAHVDADLLLVDEVLAVGDSAFRKKCFEYFGMLRGRGRTVVLVTHDMGVVERLCDRAVVLERGAVEMVGHPADAADRYHELNFSAAPRPADREGPEVAPLSEGAAITATWFEDAGGRRIAETGQGGRLALLVEAEVHEPLEDPVVVARLRNELDQIPIAANSADDHGPTGRFAAGERLRARIEFDNWLAPGRYSVTTWIARRGTGTDALDVRLGAASLVVRGGRRSGAVMEPPREFSLERL